MNDDIWDDTGTEPTELKRIERVHGDAGYLEGVTKSKQLAHQPGFDEGYSEGAQLGLRVGQILGTFQALGLHELEVKALKELSAHELFCSKYYDSHARPLFAGSEHPLIVAWQKRLDHFTSD